MLWWLGMLTANPKVPGVESRVTKVMVLFRRLSIGLKIQFMLNYNEDIVCIATDGASVMQKVGRLSNWINSFALCMFCTKKSTFAKTILKGISGNDEKSSENDDDNDENTTTDDDTNITNNDDEDFSDGRINKHRIAILNIDSILNCINLSLIHRSA
jgi:hypothetical protein